MFGIAFGHTRALAAKNMAGSRFSDYIVPLVNPNTLFKQLMKDNPDFEMIEEPIVTTPTHEIKRISKKKTAK